MENIIHNLSEVSNMGYVTQIYKEEIPERTVSFDTSIAYVLNNREAAILYNIIEYLQKHSKLKDGFAFFTYKLLRKWTGLGRHRLEKAVAALQQAGLLKIYTKGGMTYYKVLPFNEADFNENADKNKVKAEIKNLYCINIDISKIGLNAAILLSYLEMVAKKVGESTHNIFIKTQKRLGELLGMTKGEIQYAIKKLKEKNLLRTVAKFAHGINKKITHFGVLKICGKCVESLLKTLKFVTVSKEGVFLSKSKAEKQQDQSIKSTGVKQKISTPYILDNKLDSKLSSISNNSAYLNKDVVKNSYKSETSHIDVENIEDKEPKIVNGCIDLGDGYLLRISSIGEFYTYMGRLPEKDEITW